jgi:hypothetical protein
VPVSKLESDILRLLATHRCPQLQRQSGYDFETVSPADRRESSDTIA